MGNPWEVTGLAQDGLIIVKMGKDYQVVHMATGQRIGDYRKDQKTAKSDLLDMLSMGYDFTKESLAEIAASKGQTDVEMGRIFIEKYYGGRGA